MYEVSGVATFRLAALTILRKMPNNKRSDSQCLYLRTKLCLQITISEQRGTITRVSLFSCIECAAKNKPL